MDTSLSGKSTGKTMYKPHAKKKYTNASDAISDLLELKNKWQMTEMINGIKEQMCDKYCKYPTEIADDETLRVICNKCPMGRLHGVADEDRTH